MSFKDCINKALEDKKITGSKRDRAIERFDSLFEDYRQEMGDLQAAQKAAEDATLGFEIEVKEAKRRKLFQAKKVAQLQSDFSNYKGDSFGKAAQALVEYDPKAPYNNYVALNDRVRGQLFALMDNIVAKYKPHEVLGAMRQSKAGLNNLVREIFGEATNDAAAKGMIDGWNEAVEFAAKRFKQSGGSLSELKDWRLPQHQDAVKLRLTGPDDWIADHLQWLDWSKVRYPNGSRVPLAEREDFLRTSYETLMTGGAAKASKGKRATGDKLPEHRQLHFKDADSWMGMHAKYGNGTVFDAMVGHIDYMAHQISLVETFGPNPAAMRDTIHELAKANAAKIDIKNAGKKAGRFETSAIRKDLNGFDKLFGIVNREFQMLPESQFGTILGGTRNLLSSALLSSATVAAVPGDIITMRFVAGVNNMKSIRPLQKYLSLINPFNGKDRRRLARMGFVNDNAVSIAFAQKRFADVEGMPDGWTRKVSDTNFRMILLSPHTQMARYSFHSEFLGMLTDDAIEGVAFDALPYKDLLEKHGFTKSDWGKYRSTDARDFDGAKFIHPDDMTDYKLGDRLMSMIISEGRRAVPDASLRSSAALHGKTRPGEFGGELLRTASMFKNFPMAVYHLVLRDALLKESKAGKAAYVASYFLHMTAAGAITLQASAMLNGKKPAPMFEPDNPTRSLKFWGNAALRGGGLGILGDFLFADRNRYGGGLPSTFTGPMVQLANDLLNLSIGNVQQVMTGEDPQFFEELVRTVKRYTPRPWYARLAMDRMIFDQLMKASDPKAVQKMERYRLKIEEEQGHEYFWHPGETAPQF